MLTKRNSENFDCLKDSPILRENGYFGIGSSMKLSELSREMPIVADRINHELLSFIDSIDDVRMHPERVVMDRREVAVDVVRIDGLENKFLLSGPKDLMRGNIQNQKLVIFSQGLLAKRDCLSNKWMSEILHRNNICTLVYDYSKNGKEADVDIFSRAKDLAKLIVDYKERKYQVGCYGSSYGGLAFYWACHNLAGRGTMPDAIANRTILAKLDVSLSQDLIQKTGSNKFTRQYIWENIDEVVNLLGAGGLSVDREQLRDVCSGNYNADKIVEDVRCPNLNVQGSEDEKADIDSVKRVMREIGKNNDKSYLVELFGSDHGCGNNTEHYKIQLYLLSNFLIEQLNKK